MAKREAPADAVEKRASAPQLIDALIKAAIALNGSKRCRGSASQTLATVTTIDSAPRRMSAGLRAFDERRRSEFGSFIADVELRKNEHRTIASMVRRFPGLRVSCPRAGPRVGECFATTTRRLSRYAVLGGSCEVDVLVDGVMSTDNDLERLKSTDFAGIEYYAGDATIPAQYNRTGAACGVLLLWSRAR